MLNHCLLLLPYLCGGVRVCQGEGCVWSLSCNMVISVLFVVFNHFTEEKRAGCVASTKCFLAVVWLFLSCVSSSCYHQLVCDL